MRVHAHSPHTHVPGCLSPPPALPPSALKHGPRPRLPGQPEPKVPDGGWGGEWNEQAAAFAKYVTGKTAAEVAGIVITEGKPEDVDLASSVTIYIGGFQALIQKAAK